MTAKTAAGMPAKISIVSMNRQAQRPQASKGPNGPAFTLAPARDGHQRGCRGVRCRI